ncbi:hypothetical protein BDN72DRAFT_280258 [Pluteus cervinus]|uniref:Uncharacterized protein n=1 Tax=Pluteus cervinus TaxID=181527 RepID=A0ACD3AE78_9AGAR|nr:hypothetical protein BDN72DRAFT_280258 [Pluteus cervinus]
MSSLPAELIENILEHVYSEYKDLETPSDLHRCALVSRTWRAISQPLIFFELLLSEGQEEQMKMLLDTHLRQHVRKAWIEDCGSLEFIEEFFNLLPNVQGLCVLHSGPRKLMETPVPETMLKNLTSLGLSNIRSFPVQAFYNCHSLRELKINKLTFEIDIRIQPLFPSRSPISILDSLHIAGFSLPQMRILEWMLTPQCPFNLGALTTLRIADNSDELSTYTWAVQIVKLCASTVQDLRIDIPTLFADRDPNLTKIKRYANYVPWMKAFFSSLPMPNRLEETEASRFRDL